jgi:hypothetical protein
MLNDVLTVCVAAAVAVVFATILGAVELLRAPLCHIHEVWFGRRFAVDPPPHQTPSLAFASAAPERVSSPREFYSEVRHGA